MRVALARGVDPIAHRQGGCRERPFVMHHRQHAMVGSEEDAANLYIIKTFEQAFQLASCGTSPRALPPLLAGK